MTVSPRFDALYDELVGHPDTNPFGFDDEQERDVMADRWDDEGDELADRDER